MVTSVLAGAALLPAAAAGWYLGPMVARRRRERQLRRQCAAGGALVLTYDDGPGPSLTPRVLDLLKAHSARATFFPAGFRAAEHPGIVGRIIDEGHEVGCHGDRHLNAWRTWPWRAAVDLNDGYRSLDRWIPPDGLFRPPFGKMTLLTWAMIRRRGAPIGWWTVPGGDAMEELPSPTMATELVGEAGGGIVLFHDFDRQPDRAEFTLAATETLLAAAARHGWSVCTYGELTRTETRRAA